MLLELQGWIKQRTIITLLETTVSTKADGLTRIMSEKCEERILLRTYNVADNFFKLFGRKG